MTLIVANRRSIEERLLTHEIDLAVMSLIERQECFTVEFLLPYELVVVAPPSHRLVGRSALVLHDLQQETFLLREQGSGTRSSMERFFAERGFAPKIRNVMDSNEQRLLTDSSGNYKFINLAAGTFKVREVLQSGYVQTLPASNLAQTVTVTSGQSASGKNFGVDN